MENKRRTVLIILGIIILVLIISIVLFYIKDNSAKANDKFKREYESYNDSYTKVNILYDNKFIYKKEADFEKLLNETAIIYFGNAKSNECRNAVNILQHINTNKIYYIDTSNIEDYESIINLIDSSLVYDGSYMDKPVVVGIKDGVVVSYHIGTLDGITDEELTKEKQEELKNIYDDINSKVYNDTCGIEDPEGC